MKQTMTHNEYQEFLKKNASRLYADPGYTMDDYQRDADGVTILAFELDKFNLTDEMKKVINDAFASESTNKHGNMYVSGHYHTFSFVNGVADALGCENVCRDAYKGFYKNDDARLVLEYCEGDVSLILCETDEAYKTEIASFFKFYEVERPVFVKGSYNLYLDGDFQGKAFTDKEVKDFILRDAKEDGAVKPLCVLQDRKHGYNEVSVDVSLKFFAMLNDRLPGAEDNACIEVYFDGVLVDNVYTSMDKAEAMEYSLVQHGYDDYNGDVKEDWERTGGRPNPDMSFRVVEYPEKTLDAVLADANERSAETGNEKTGKDEYEKE